MVSDKSELIRAIDKYIAVVSINFIALHVLFHSEWTPKSKSGIISIS